MTFSTSNISYFRHSIK